MLETVGSNHGISEAASMSILPVDESRKPVYLLLLDDTQNFMKTGY